MKAEIKKAWIAALRSGEYSQGRNFMCQQLLDGRKEFCCLGVLAEVAKVPAEPTVGRYDSGMIYLGGHMADTEQYKKEPTPYFSEEGLKTIGLTSAQQQRLYQMNDGNGGTMDRQWKFSEIADWIEEDIIPEEPTP
jgi:hypothetical protein